MIFSHLLFHFYVHAFPNFVSLAARNPNHSSILLSIFSSFSLTPTILTSKCHATVRKVWLQLDEGEAGVAELHYGCLVVTRVKPIPYKSIHRFGEGIRPGVCVRTRRSWACEAIGPNRQLALARDRNPNQNP